jgi:hypothetical protein
VSFQPDRSLTIPPGHRVSTGYVDVFQCRLACRERMAVGDVDRSYQRLLQQAPSQSWPPPVGRWEADRFVIEDGRHEYIAAVMLGFSHLFVAWQHGGLVT